MKKMFPLGAVLSIADGKLMCQIGQVYEILNFMTGDNLFTHQLPRASDECRPVLLKQHPWLQEYIDLKEEVTPETFPQVMAKYEARWGKEVAVEELSAVDNHAFKNPISELVDMMGSKKVIVVETDGSNG